MNQEARTPPAVPDHQLLRRVGRGSYGEVWLARNVMGTFRAVKVVYRASFESERPYEREFNGLQKFEPVSRTHPGFVSLLHIGRSADSGYFYCVMEVADDVVKGQAIEPENYRPRTLASDIVEHRRLPLEECVKLGIALAAALGHLHSRGLVHRDIKPSNIIFVNGEPKFADIGLVTDIGAKATFVGTEGYLPPEGPGAPGADLYGLGKLLYEIGMGKSAEQFPELPTRLRELPEAAGLMRLNSIVLKACEAQAAKRYPSAAEMEKALAGLERELVRVREGEQGSRSSSRSVLILCPSAESADVSFASALMEQLKKEGHSVESNEAGTLSVEWARNTEERIQNSQVTVAFLSQATVNSEEMAYAMEMAQLIKMRPKPRIIAVQSGVPEATARQMMLGVDNVTWVAMEGEAIQDEALRRIAKAIEGTNPLK
jgi:serine/threonine protein kinase